MAASTSALVPWALLLCAVFSVSSTRSMREIRVLEGEDAVIPCSLNGNSAHVVWQNGSTVLSSGQEIYLHPSMRDRVTVADGTNDNYDLVIRRATVYDAGEYSCQARGRETHYRRLIVNVPPSIDVFPANEVMTVEEDEEFQMQCTASGNPPPTVKWTFHTGAGSRELSVRRRDVLRIATAEHNNTGRYTCTADNGVGSPVSHTFHVVVEYAPNLSLPAEVLYVIPGQDATIECYFMGYPDVEVSWLHNKTPINFTVHTNMMIGHKKTDQYDIWHLDIRQVKPQDLGEYTCIGENKMGLVRDNIRLSPKPFIVEITSRNKSNHAHRYTLQWIVPPHLNILDFQIAMSPLERSSTWHNFTAPASSLNQPRPYSYEYTFRNLTSNTSYAARVRARNYYGFSSWSDAVVFQTSSDDTAEHPLPTPSLQQLDYSIASALIAAEDVSAAPKQSSYFFVAFVAFLLAKNIGIVC